MDIQEILIPRDDCCAMGYNNSMLREQLNTCTIESILDALGQVSVINNRYDTSPTVFTDIFDYLKTLNKGYVVEYNGNEYLLAYSIVIAHIIDYNDGQNILCVPMEMINDILTWLRENNLVNYDLREADFMSSGELPDIFSTSWGEWKQENITFPPVKVANALGIAHSEQTFYPVRTFDSTLTVNITYREEDMAFQYSAQFSDNGSGYAENDYLETLLNDASFGKSYVTDYNEYYNSLEDSPPPQPPENVVIGLINAYNPDSNAMLEFARWVWETDAWNDIQGFKSPVNSILGTRLLYVKPDIKETQETVKVGNIDTKVMSNVCDGIFVNVDCGSVFIQKKYENVHDYRDVIITLYLPFIGYNDIETALCMGKEIQVNYTVNILNGDCVAHVVIVENDGEISSQLETYTYNGNMGVSIPMNGSVSNMSDVDLNNPLAMLSHVPYIDVIRPVPYEPQDKNRYEGLPSNETVQLANVTGYTKCKSVFIEGLTATSTEIDTIKQLLESGVIL